MFMDIAELLGPGSVIAALKGSGKKRVLQERARRAAGRRAVWILGRRTPEGAGADRLKGLARVSRLFRDRAMCGKLRGTDNVDARTALLTDRHASHAA